MKKGTIVDTGDVAQGGCGYIIRLEEDKSELKPEYLQSAYQHQGLKVKVKYTTEGQQQVCSTNPNNAVYEVIQVQDIKRDLD